MNEFPEFHHNRADRTDIERIVVLREDLEIIIRAALISAQLDAAAIKEISEAICARAVQISRFGHRDDE